MTARRLAILLVCCSLLLVAGCVGADQENSKAGPTVDERAPADNGASAGNGGATDGASDGSGGNDEMDAEFSTAGDEGTTREGQRLDRQLIRTGTLKLTVDNADDTEAQIRTITTDRGGFVARSQREVHTRGNDSWTTTELVLRVPAEEFDDVFDELQTHGDVEAASTDTEDVTDRLVDIEARLGNLRAERDRLRDLFENAEGTEQVLAVQSELADVQEEIERLEAQQRSLEDQVAMATISVTIAEEPPDGSPPDTDPAWYQTGPGEAFMTSVSTLGTAIRATVIAIVYVLPFGLLLSSPFVLGAVVYRWRK